MIRSKLGDLHPYDLEIDKSLHRLSRSNRSRSVVVHDSVVLYSNVVHTEFIANSIFYFVSEPKVSYKLKSGLIHLLFISVQALIVSG